jgi:hypothetical protein
MVSLPDTKTEHALEAFTWVLMSIRKKTSGIAKTTTAAAMAISLPFGFFETALGVL